MIVIIDYNLGNPESIRNMLRKAGISSSITQNHNNIKDASKLILPGVGNFDKGINNLKQLGLIELLNQKVINEQTPILGICLGMQLLTERSDEGDENGLGWIKGSAKHFNINDDEYKIPHMGWNSIQIKNNSTPLLRTKLENQRFYFVHSYFVDCKNDNDILATTNYSIEFCSAVCKNNIMGVQFHPEKSHKYGMEVLRNFAELNS